MMRLASLLCAFSLCLFTGVVHAQDSPWQPEKIPFFNFRQTAVAKIYTDENGATVLGLITFPIKTEIATVTKQKTETRTRVETDPESGKTREVAYTVSVPYSEEIEKQKLTRLRLEVPLESTKIWTVAGKLLPPGEATKLLATPRRCLLYPSVNYLADPFFNELLKQDVLIIWYDKKKTKEVSESGK